MAYTYTYISNFEYFLRQAHGALHVAPPTAIVIGHCHWQSEGPGCNYV